MVTGGYLINSGYMGYEPKENKYMLFATEQEYLEYLKEKYNYED